MPRYRVEAVKAVSGYVEVEANTVEEAYEEAQLNHYEFEPDGDTVYVSIPESYEDDFSDRVEEIKEN